jgi:hypothetical protein
MNELVQLSPHALLVGALNILGWVLKQSPIKNWLIPVILPTVGAAAYPFLPGALGEGVVTNVLVGVSLGWTAVGTNQFVRQVANGRANGRTSSTSLDTLTKKDTL